MHVCKPFTFHVIYSVTFHVLENLCNGALYMYNMYNSMAQIVYM